jgi:hypothetical protein
MQRLCQWRELFAQLSLPAQLVAGGMNPNTMPDLASSLLA